MSVSKHKCRIELGAAARERLFRLVWLLDRSPQEIIQSALSLPAEAAVDESRVRTLEDALRNGQARFAHIASQVSTVQSRYAGAKLTLFEKFQQNRPLVVNLAGMIAENRSLRRAAGLPPQSEELNRELDRLFQGYIKRDVRKLADAPEISTPQDS